MSISQTSENAIQDPISPSSTQGISLILTNLLSAPAGDAAQAARHQDKLSYNQWNCLKKGHSFTRMDVKC
jgi:type III secretory pathway component EscR